MLPLATGEFSAISGGKRRSFPLPSVHKRWPLPEKGVYASYTLCGAITEAADHLGWDPGEATAAVQGFGQVGSVTAATLHGLGCPVVAVSDSRGGIHDPAGLDVPAVQRHVAETGSVTGFLGAAALTNAELLECDCAVLVPAAVQGVITADNAERIRARLLVEGANGPTTLEAEERLLARGVTVVPDIIANSGSVHVCQMERTQGLYDNYWDAETIDGLRRARLLEAYRAAAHTAHSHGLESMRLGAWINALGRIGAAAQLRGWC